MEKTRTGKDVFKSFVSAARASRVVSVAGYRGVSRGDMIFLIDEQLPGNFSRLRAQESFFGLLPRVWSYGAMDNKMIGETCVPVGSLGVEEFELFAQPEKFGLNFMAKGADWPAGHLQVPKRVARFIPTVMPIMAFLRANLPDARLWPAVEIVFKISAGQVKKDKSGLDPFLEKKQATDWHTDGDSVSDLERMRGQAKAAFDGPARKPSSNALAFLKQRLIVSSDFPTGFSEGWEFVEDGTVPVRGEIIARSNGYPLRRVINPVIFPAGTVVAFTNNNMHTAINADHDGHRAVMVVSGVIRHGPLRKIFERHPEMRQEFSTRPPGVIAVPECWQRAESRDDILRHSAALLSFAPQGIA